MRLLQQELLKEGPERGPGAQGGAERGCGRADLGAVLKRPVPFGEDVKQMLREGNRICMLNRGIASDQFKKHPVGNYNK